MKNWTKLLIFGLACILVFTFASGAFTAPKKYHFVLVSRLYGHPYWKNVEDGQMTAAKKLGIDAQYIGPDAVEVAPQINEMESLIAEEVDGIAVGPNDPEALNPYIQKAIDAGIPVITLDTDAPKSARLTYIGTDNKAAGKIAGEKMAKLTKGAGQIGIIVAGIGSANMNERLAGVKEALAKYPKMKVLTVEDGKGDLNTDYQVAVAMLQGYKEMTGIIGLSADAPLGIAKAVEEAKKQGQIKIAGFDALPQTVDYIKSGTISGTVVQREWLMGYLTMATLLKIKQGEKVPPMVDTGTLWADKSNVDKLPALLKKAPK